MDIELWSCTIFWSKMALLHKLIFVRNTINIILMYFLVRFIMQNFKKIHRMDQELRGCTILGPKWPSCAKWEFFQKNHYYNFHVTLGSFHFAKFQKKILRRNPKSWGCAIFRSKMACLSPKENIFRKYISKPYCVHSCLSTNKRSESDVTPRMRYWWLKNTKIWLA